MWNTLMLIPLPFQQGKDCNFLKHFFRTVSLNLYIFRYGDVYWTMMDPVPLDPELVARFKDKTMAIVGYESDQVGFKEM